MSKATPEWIGDVRSSAEYDVMVARNVRVPMRDGVCLATDITFPAHACDRVPGSRPVILVRTPYDKTAQAATAEFYARRGYIFAAQDVRGRYASEGSFFAFADEGEDGYDAVEWLAGQPWCNGRVGTLGASYCAAAQSALACFAPPHLSAMIVQFGPSSYFHSSMRHNGVLELRFLVYAFSMASTSREASRDARIRAALEDACRNVWKYVDSGPIRKGTTPLALIPSYEQWAIDISTHGCYDDFWRRPGFGPAGHYDEHADVPTLYVGGWYDTYPRGTIENFTSLGQGRPDRVHLLMGPWHHGGVGLPEAGDAVFSSSARIPFEQVCLRWFDAWLKGMDTGVSSDPPVTYFVSGVPSGGDSSRGPIDFGGEWRTSDCWPVAGMTETPFYLHGGGILSQSLPGSAAEAKETRYLYDPSDPVPTIGGNLSAMPLPAGAFDQRGDARFGADLIPLPLSARQDVLVYATEPLDCPVEATGPVTARLYVSTDGADTDFTVKLVDMFPPTDTHPAGAAVNITDSIARLRFRNSYEREEPAEPGVVYLLEFSLYPVGHRFETGHRIRIDISSSNYPRFERNPNTGGVLGDERRKRVAENTVHHNDRYPSCVLLPIVPVD
jgi:putative CocE/NonD family hydrolase